MLDADTIHSIILLAGLWTIINEAFVHNWLLLHLMVIALVWVVGYYGFVKLLPPELSGQ